MKIKWNPVFLRETGQRVKSIKFGITVFVYNFILLIIAIFGFEVAFNVQWNAYANYRAAVMVYLVLIAIEMTMVVFLVPAYTAGSITMERERKTLDLLLTSTMKPSSIIYGKMASSLSMVLLLVFSSLPIVSIVFTIGGMEIGDLIQVFLVILITAVFIGSMGIWSSTLYKKTTQAILVAFAMVFIICVVTGAFVVVVYALRHMYYNSVMHGHGTAPNTFWAVLPLLLNPIVTIVRLVSSQYGDVSYFTSSLNRLGDVPSIIEQNWFVISLILQMACAALFIRLSEKRLNK